MTNKNKAKDDIIEAASRFFRLHGYYGVGLSEIIKESGTAKGSLYYYFPEGKIEKGSSNEEPFLREMLLPATGL